MGSFNIDAFVNGLAGLTVILTMFGMGLSLTFAQAFSLWRKPALLLVSLLSTLVIVPLAASVITLLFPLPDGVRVAILLAASIAGAGLAPKFAEMARGDLPYAIGLMATLCILAVATAPLTVGLLIPGARLPPGQVAVTVLVVQLIPLFLGLLINARWMSIAGRIAGPVNRIAGLLFPLLVLLIIVKDLDEIIALRATYGVFAIALLTLVALVAGHMLGGKDDGMRSVLAISSAVRSLGLGILLATTAFPDAVGPLAAYGVIELVVTSLYAVMMTRRWRARNLRIDLSEQTSAFISCS